MRSVTQGLKSPVRLAIDHQDIVYVTDAYQKCIVKYSNSGEFLGTIEPGGQPISIAINDANQIFIGDGETGAILKLDEKGTATEFCSETLFPSSMVFGPDNLLYVVDSKLKTVVVLDMTGSVVRTIGEGTLVFPTGIAFSHMNDRICVSEHGGIGTGFKPVVKIWTFDLHGGLVGSVGSHGSGDGQFYRIQGLAAGRCGKIYATDPFQGTISVFSEAGFITRFGEFGEESGQLNAPVDVVADSHGYIWVSSMNNGSLEVYKIIESAPSSHISEASTGSIENENFVKIYPNPASGAAVIEFNSPVQSDLIIRITNLKGQTVYTKVFNMQEAIEHIDLSTLPKGMYTVRFISDEFIRTKKIIINK